MLSIATVDFRNTLFGSHARTLPTHAEECIEISNGACGDRPKNAPTKNAVSESVRDLLLRPKGGVVPVAIRNKGKNDPESQPTEPVAAAPIPTTVAGPPAPRKVYSEQLLKSLRPKGTTILPSVRSSEVFRPPVQPAPEQPTSKRSRHTEEKASRKARQARHREAQAATPTVKPICLDYLKGLCDQRRWKCKYAHPSLPVTRGLSTDPSEEVCEVWILTGFCKFGDNCRNYHPPLEESLTGVPIAPPMTSKYHRRHHKGSSAGGSSSNSNSDMRSSSEFDDVVSPQTSPATPLSSSSASPPSSPSFESACRKTSNCSAAPTTPTVSVVPSIASAGADQNMRKVISLLNKLTPEKFDSLVQQLYELLSAGAGITLHKVLPLVFAKAVSEVHMSTVYAQLCSRLCFWADPQQQEVLCAQLFQLVKTLLDVESLMLSDMPEAQRTKLHAKRLANMQFLGELLKLELVTDEQVTATVKDILQRAELSHNPDESAVHIEMACRLLSASGGELDQRHQQFVSCCLTTLQRLVKDQPPRIQVLVLNVNELRNVLRWMPRREEVRPRTLAEISAAVDARNYVQEHYQHTQQSYNPIANFVPHYQTAPEWSPQFDQHCWPPVHSSPLGLK